MSKRKSIWENPAPYGTYEGERGNPEQWRTFFDMAWNKETAEEVLKDTHETPWSILGVEADASKAEIKAAFKKQMKINHPDKGGDLEKAKQIVAAYVMMTE